MDPLVRAKQLSFEYSGRTALDGLNFTIPKHASVALLGQNGSGKSTLAKLIAGLLLPSSGSLQIDGTPVDEQHALAIHKKIGMVMQNPANQFIAASVYEDLAFGLENQRMGIDEMKAKLAEVVDYFGLSGILNQNPKRLSGGQQQIVALAESLIDKPDLLILDEATSMLDSQSGEKVINLVERERRKRGFTIINITHDEELAAKADILLVLDHGKLVYNGSPNDFFENHELLTHLKIKAPYSVRLREAFKQHQMEMPKNLDNEEKISKWITKLF